MINPKIWPFRFWSQKVLPLVYDDSLSYYEVLCKLTKKINELVEYLNEKIDADIADRLRTLFMNVIYNEEEQSIVFRIDEEDENA